jgi:hypothetical protein
LLALQVSDLLHLYEFEEVYMVETRLNLKAMPIDALLELRDEIISLLRKKAEEFQRQLHRLQADGLDGVNELRLRETKPEALTQVSRPRQRDLGRPRVTAQVAPIFDQGWPQAQRICSRPRSVVSEQAHRQKAAQETKALTGKY